MKETFPISLDREVYDKKSTTTGTTNLEKLRIWDSFAPSVSPAETTRKKLRNLFQSQPVSESSHHSLRSNRLDPEQTGNHRNLDL